MRKLILAAAGGVLALSLAIHAASAGPDKVQIPMTYASSYVKIATIDRYDNKTVRTVYMNPEAWAAAKPGEPLPDGTTLILEGRSARLGPDGQPMLDANGRFIPTDQIVLIATQQKRRGWGTEYPENIRNGEWEYAVFQTNGSLNTGANLQPCMQCHKPRAADDFTMVAARIVKDQKK
ncbi:MAG TPA: cytochrome P460 family protein [Alphaproteobacteria bacterium]|nr:cytochrome P460 family protein [Alphaproteobacteria bacterium]